jgi:hypothetical protein
MAIGKCLSLYLVAILAVSSLLMVLPVNAQTISRPSVPIFTLKYQDNSYQDNSATYIQNQTIQINIEHQPITNSESLLYIINEKSHNNTDWHSTGVSFSADIQSQSTLIVYALKGNNASNTFNGTLQFTVGDIVDFKIYAILYQYLGPSDGHIQSGYWQEVSRSQWSNTQTLTIGETCSTVTPTPSVPEFSITVTLIALLVVVSLLLIIGKRKVSIEHTRPRPICLRR